jgi:tetratricopeptide (TPR) repeat protein
VFRTSAFLVAACLTAPAHLAEPPLADTRLSVHTLVREDVFAGVLDGKLERLARGERSIDALLEKRPADKAGLLAWKAAALMYRAVLAHEAKRAEEFEGKYAEAVKLLAQAKKLGPDDTGVLATTGGMYVLLADRLPEKQRGEAWPAAYEAYQGLWKQQARVVEKLPLHMRGELLGGLAQAAQRTGRAKELSEYLAKIIAEVPESAYARAAKRWQEDPRAAAKERLSCLTCHAPGRLAARQASLADK